MSELRLANSSRPSLALRLGVLVAAIVLSGAAWAGDAGKTLQQGPWGSEQDAIDEQFLLGAEIVEAKDIGTGVTRPKRLKLDLDGRSGRAAWKAVDKEFARPDTGQSRLKDLYFSDRWQHEIAAYRIDRMLGIRRVPVTVARSVNGEPGSAQFWVEDAFSERDRVQDGIALESPSAYADASALMAVFDALIYNVDRSQENILITASGSRAWWIDHSRAFRLTGRLPGKLQIDRGRLPSDLGERLSSLDREKLDLALGELLSKGQIKALLKRRDRLVEWLGKASSF